MFKLVNRMKNRKGFTLIELVVVIAILGILALIAIPRFAGIREDAQTEADEATAIAILNAAELYYIQGGIPDADGSNLITAGLLREGIEGSITIGASDSGVPGTYKVTYDPDDRDAVIAP